MIPLLCLFLTQDAATAHGNTTGTGADVQTHLAIASLILKIMVRESSGQHFQTLIKIFAHLRSGISYFRPRVASVNSAENGGVSDVVSDQLPTNANAFSQDSLTQLAPTTLNNGSSEIFKESSTFSLGDNRGSYPSTAQLLIALAPNELTVCAPIANFHATPRTHRNHRRGPRLCLSKHGFSQTKRRLSGMGTIFLTNS